MFNEDTSDMISADYRVYIEGIQVPFEAVSISSVYGSLPTANITLPPWPGLQELGRNYMPKVNIFWGDHNFNPSVGEQTSLGNDLRDVRRDSFKLIYSGVISGTVDNKSISPESASQSMTLNCVHELTFMNDILIKYGNQAIQASLAQLAANADSSTIVAEWDINTLMVKALIGIKAGVDPDDVHYVDPKKFSELQGTPGILKVMWNALKRDATSIRNKGTSKVLTELYIPLVEDGIKFWERMTGHPSIEGGIQDEESRIPILSTSTQNEGTEKEINADIKGEVMVPPVFRSFLGEAAQKELTLASVQSLQSGAGSPESTDFMTTITKMIRRLEYDMVVLNSPVSVGDTGSRRYDYIVKPILPSYYSPICNVVLPNLINSLTVNNNYEAMPSRTVNLSNVVSQVSTGTSTGGTPDQSYISPHSVRYARAGGDKGDLFKSLSTLNNEIGKYEYGSGVRSKVTQLPSTYNLMKMALDKNETENGEDTNVVGSANYTKALNVWNNLYSNNEWPGIAKYNPLSTSSNVSSFNRLNFLYSDQQFAQEVSKARTAQAQGVFNPYAIVGYPMDLVDSVPNRESYHGLCTSISHTIHASGSAYTNYGVSAVSTFSELAQYKMPSINPYLGAVFNLDVDYRIYANSTAYVKACEIYLEVLGVGAAEPALLQDYHTGMPIPFTRTSGCWSNGTSDYLDTVRGSLVLIARNITSLYEMDIERAADGLSAFVDISDWSDVDSSNIQTVNSATYVEMSEDRTKIITPGIDPESSPFLDY